MSAATERAVHVFRCQSHQPQRKRPYLTHSSEDTLPICRRGPPFPPVLEQDAAVSAPGKPLKDAWNPARSMQGTLISVRGSTASCKLGGDWPPRASQSAPQGSTEDQLSKVNDDLASQPNEKKRKNADLSSKCRQFPF